MDEHERNAERASAVNIIAGLWTIASPFIFAYTGNTTLLWNNVILGIIIALFGLYRVANPQRSGWLSELNVIIGVWLIISNFVYAFPDRVARWDEIIIGAVVAVFGAVSYRQTRRIAM